MVGPDVRRQMKPRDRGRQTLRHAERQRVPSGQPIEQRVLIEARHVDAPVDRIAAAIQRESAARLLCDRHHATINGGRRSTIQAHFGLARGTALRRRREVQVVESNGALQLQRAVAGEEDNGAMGIDPFHRQSAVGRG
jgi:hypothetical protein